RPVVLFAVGDGSQDSFGRFNFPGKAVEHHVAIGQGKIGGGSGHSSFSLSAGVDRNQQDRLRSDGLHYSSRKQEEQPPSSSLWRKRDSHRGPQQALLEQSHTATGCFAPTGTGVSQA